MREERHVLGEKEAMPLLHDVEVGEEQKFSMSSRGSQFCRPTGVFCPRRSASARTGSHR
jgi:hypothetical protein